jgi:ERCC4-type nuclease
MKIIIDEREHALYKECQAFLSNGQFTSIILDRQVLALGDVLLRTNDDKDILLIERKSFSDLLSSIKDGRYEEQSYRLLNSGEFLPHSIFYLIEGIFSQLRAPNDKKIIMSAMTSLQYFKGFSLYRTSSVYESAEWVVSMANKIERELAKGKQPYFQTAPYLRNNNAVVIENEMTTTTSNNVTGADYCAVVKKVKKDNITPENIGEIILCQIPGISSVTAITIMKNFNGFPHFMDELQKNPACIENITIETNGKIRKINKSSISNIRQFLLSAPTNQDACV